MQQDENLRPTDDTALRLRIGSLEREIETLKIQHQALQAEYRACKKRDDQQDELERLRNELIDLNNQLERKDDQQDELEHLRNDVIDLNNQLAGEKQKNTELRDHKPVVEEGNASNDVKQLQKALDACREDKDKLSNIILKEISNNEMNDEDVNANTISSAWNDIAMQIQRLVMKFYYPEPNPNYVPVERHARHGLPLEPKASQAQYHYLDCWGRGLNAMDLSNRARSTVFRYLFEVALAQPVFGLHELDNYGKLLVDAIEKGLQQFENLLAAVDTGRYPPNPKRRSNC